MRYAHVLSVFILLLADFVNGQCDGSASKIKEGNGKIKSPNFDTGGEHGNAANCGWEFEPHADGKQYALVLTVEEQKLYVVKNARKHCLGSYNLTLNHAQTMCDRYIHGPRAGVPPTPGNDFCNAYYSSPTCETVSQIQGCETKRETTYPVSVSYFSDGRRDSDASVSSMYFKLSYNFIECPGGEIITEPTTEVTTSTTTTSVPLTTTTSTKTTIAPATIELTSTPAAIEATSVSATTKTITGSTVHVTKQATENTSPNSGSITTIILISVIVFLLIIIGLGVAGFLYKRFKGQSTNNIPSIRRIKLQGSDDGIYGNDPPPLGLSPNTSQQQLPEDGYEICHNYEEIKTQRTPIAPTPLIQTTEQEGKYEVHMMLQPESFRPIVKEAKYENVAQFGEYENLGKQPTKKAK